MKPILMGVMAAILAAGAQSNDAERQLKVAINAELVNGDLKAAIKQYGEIAAKNKNDRVVTAMALVHMAECYRKMGDAESSKLYERVVREYADQKEAVAMARSRLGVAQATRITSRQVWSASPRATIIYSAVSADGRYFPYVDFAQNGNLFLHDFAGGTDRRLTTTSTDNTPGQIEEYAEATAFSRDGKKLAYSWFTKSKDRFELRVIGLQGNGVPQPAHLPRCHSASVSGIWQEGHR